jgi:hypothetical protein
MADELTISGGFRFAKGSVNNELDPWAIAVDVTGTDAMRNMQTVGITEEALYLGDIGSGGYVKIVNRDATNFVKVRAASAASDLIKLLPGEFAIFRLVATTPYVIADTAPCVIEYCLVEL